MTGSEGALFVQVPVDIARRIRLTLDHIGRDRIVKDANGDHIGNELAVELLACDGYPLDREPWGDDPGVLAEINDIKEARRG